MKNFSKFLKDKSKTRIQRFTVYRKAINDVGAKTHNNASMNADDEPQYEGVIFTDGTVVLRWLTKFGASEFFDNIEAALTIHGHPEYETEIIWHDGPAPKIWTDQVKAYKKKHEKDSR